MVSSKSLYITFGKSVRRVISENTSDEKTALRYQNKYRNLLKHDKKMVEKVEMLDESIKTLTEELGRKVTIDELAIYMNKNK